MISDPTVLHLLHYRTVVPANFLERMSFPALFHDSSVRMLSLPRKYHRGISELLLVEFADRFQTNLSNQPDELLHYRIAFEQPPPPASQVTYNHSHMPTNHLPLHPEAQKATRRKPLISQQYFE
jgi:hypothetical protein